MAYPAAQGATPPATPNPPSPPVFPPGLKVQHPSSRLRRWYSVVPPSVAHTAAPPPCPPTVAQESTTNIVLFNSDEWGWDAARTVEPYRLGFSLTLDVAPHAVGEPSRASHSEGGPIRNMHTLLALLALLAEAHTWKARSRLGNPSQCL